MHSLIESILYWIVKIFGLFMRALAIHWALWVGRVMGRCVYCFDVKHRTLVYANLKIAFSRTKTPRQLRKITKQVFLNYGQNIIELLRLPTMTDKTFEKYVTIEGKEHIEEAMRQKKGLILLAMHFGSWEMASLATGMMGNPYKVLVKPQNRFERLDNLLNSYRRCHGSVIIERGLGTRKFVESLKNNEIVGLVVDQGGKEGVLVPFFERHASMSSGAIRVGLKLGVPICFSIIIRENGPYHRFIVHKPLELETTGNLDEDIKTNLMNVVRTMEDYVLHYPSEYMWFYKIWKYSKEATVLVLNDGRTGHLRQSQAVSSLLLKALAEREVRVNVIEIPVRYKHKIGKPFLSLFGLFTKPFLFQGRLNFLKWFLTPESFSRLMSIKADFVISCGSSLAAMNFLVSHDQLAKSITVLHPGILRVNQFDLTIIPEHDYKKEYGKYPQIVATKAAPNLVTSEYLKSQSDQLLNRFSHLKSCNKFKIGFLIGGDTRSFKLSEKHMRIVVNQLKTVADELDADILVTTSRRTTKGIENILIRELKKSAHCQLFILANEQNIPEAVGGILGLVDVVVVSGDSISMISEAASSGKKTVVFPVAERLWHDRERNKHNVFIDKLNAEGYILCSNIRNISQGIYNLAKNKIQLKSIDDNQILFESLKSII